jgi:hypothetical protein
MYIIKHTENSSNEWLIFCFHNIKLLVLEVTASFWFFFSPWLHFNDRSVQQDQLVITQDKYIM